MIFKLFKICMQHAYMYAYICVCIYILYLREGKIVLHPLGYFPKVHNSQNWDRSTLGFHNSIHISYIAGSDSNTLNYPLLPQPCNSRTLDWKYTWGVKSQQPT